jgi:TRAP-type C4-dicarboxylate transport system substrate-binding protein
MNKKIIILMLLFIFICSGAVWSQRIKLASVAPEQSPWGDALNKLAADWAKISNGRIQVQIYHNAIAGDERDMLRKMKIGQLQAGVFTSFGLKQIVEESLAISIPLLIQTNDELNYVLKELRPFLERRIEEERFKALAWSVAGWIRFFGKRPIITPADLRDMKLSANPHEHELLQTWKLLGFHPVPVAFSETLSALNSGMVDSLYSSPIVAAGYQWFGVANHMTKLKVAPFIGTIIIDERTWRRIPEEMKPALEKNLREMETRLDNSILELEQKSLDTMKSYGLIVHELQEKQKEEWYEVFEEGRDLTVGTVFNREMAERIQKILEDVR